MTKLSPYIRSKYVLVLMVHLYIHGPIYNAVSNPAWWWAFRIICIICDTK